jgi:hypothetical protein
MPYRRRYAARRIMVMNGNDGGWSQPVPPPGYPPYPPYFAPPTQPVKPRWPWIVGGIMAVLVLVVVAGLVIFTVARDDQPQAVTVTYEVTGPPGEVEVTYWDSDDNRSDPQPVTLPWRTQVTMRGEDKYTSLSVEQAKSSDEPVKCRITADGKVIQENESVGIFVSCSGRVGAK